MSARANGGNATSASGGSVTVNNDFGVTRKRFGIDQTRLVWGESHPVKSHIRRYGSFIFSFSTSGAVDEIDSPTQPAALAPPPVQVHIRRQIVIRYSETARLFAEIVPRGIDTKPAFVYSGCVLMFD